MSNAIKLKVGYRDSTQTRNYTIDDVADTDIMANTVRAKVKEFNTYLAAVDTLTAAPVFVDSEGNAAQAVTEAKIIVVEETPIEGV